MRTRATGPLYDQVERTADSRHPRTPYPGSLSARGMSMAWRLTSEVIDWGSRRGVVESLGALAWTWTKILVAASPLACGTATPGCAGGCTATGGGTKHRQECLCHGGSLRAVEGVEETGGGLGVGRVIFPSAKVPDHLAYHIGLAGVVPFIEKVIVNADGEENVLIFAVFLLQRALDFADDGREFGASWFDSQS